MLLVEEEEEAVQTPAGVALRLLLLLKSVKEAKHCCILVVGLLVLRR